MLAADRFERGRAGVHDEQCDDPVNRLLDVFEDQCEALIAIGLEVQMRSRLARLLPAPPQPAAGQQFEGGIDREIALAGALGVLARVKRWKSLSAAEVSLLGLLGALGGEELERARTARTRTPTRGEACK